MWTRSFTRENAAVSCQSTKLHTPFFQYRFHFPRIPAKFIINIYFSRKMLAFKLFNCCAVYKNLFCKQLTNAFSSLQRNELLVAQTTCTPCAECAHPSQQQPQQQIAQPVSKLLVYSLSPRNSVDALVHVHTLHCLPIVACSCCSLDTSLFSIVCL